MVFVIDLDDTVCDTDGYSELFIKNFIKQNNLPHKFVKSCSRYAEGKFDWSEKEANKWYKTYGDKMMREFPVKGDAVEVINKLYDFGHKIVICTARETDWHSDPVGATKFWCEKVGLHYNKIYIGRVDKEQVCESEEADVFVDDDINLTQKVCQHFKSMNKNISVFLATSNFNKGLQVPHGAIRIHSFGDITKTLNID